MLVLRYILVFMVILTKCAAELVYTNDFNFRVDAGTRSCFFETGNAGQMMEVYYQVLDGQHGDLDISIDVIDPTGKKIVNDYKKSHNSIIKDLVLDGTYSICLDNTFSVMNSKLVFIYVQFEDPESEKKEEVEVSVLDNEGQEQKEVEVLHWTGTDDDGEYYIAVEDIADSLTRTLKHVVKARHMLDLYAAGKSRDSYLAFEGTFVVDVWSGFQISCMCVVGLVQVYMIKNLFRRSSDY